MGGSRGWDWGDRIVDKLVARCTVHRKLLTPTPTATEETHAR